MALQSKFPQQKIVEFWERSLIAVSNAKRNSKRLTKPDKLEEIIDFLQNIFCDEDVAEYGSRPAGIGNHYSDADLNISNPNKSVQNMMNALVQEIRQDPDWQIKIALLNATVPILRCVYLPKGIICK